jgi:hypothetical protein
MPLAGASLNRHESDSNVNDLVALFGAFFKIEDALGRLDALRRKLLQQAAESPRPTEKVRLRSGAVQAAVVDALCASPQPMGVKDVHRAVEYLLSMRVSKDSVNSCLSLGARGQAPRFERVGRGRYRLLGESS